jgi:hypothetical protein
MKTTIIAVFAALTIASQFAYAAPAPTTTPVTPTQIDARVIARAFVLKPYARCQCFLQGNMLVNGGWTWMNIDFTMEKDGAITQMFVNSVQIPIPTPIYGIPLGDGGLMRDVYLNVNATTADGEYAGFGYLQQEAVSKGDNLIVELTPAGIKTEIPFDITNAGNVQLIIEGFPYGYGYGSENGKFFVELPPVGGRYHYIIKRWSDGVVLGEGWVEPFKPTEESNDTFVGVSYLGNVVEVGFKQPAGVNDWETIAGFDLNCTIPTTTGSSVMGKVFFADAGAGNLDLMISGDYLVYVQSATSTGDMPYLLLANHSTNNQGWIETRMVTTAGSIGKVVITIIPRPGAVNNQAKPWLSVYRFYGPWTADGGPG